MGFFSKIFKKKKKNTIEKVIDDQVQKVEQLPGIFTKEFLEDLIKKYPKLDHPNIIESDGKLKFVDINGHISQLRIPLLTIVPIPYISKDSVDLNKYYEDNFGKSEGIKSLDEIKGVQVNVPALNIVPIPSIPKEKIDTDFNNKKTSKNKKK